MTWLDLLFRLVIALVLGAFSSAFIQSLVDLAVGGAQ